MSDLDAGVLAEKNSCNHGFAFDNHADSLQHTIGAGGSCRIHQRNLR